MKRIVVYNKDKGITNSPEVLETIQLWLDTVRNGQYTIEMKKVVEKRSVSQNKLMWLWFSAIADAWSDATDRAFTRNDVHDAYCLMFLPIDTPKGRVGGSTSGLSTEEMSEFLEKVHADAADDGITLLNPEDKMFEQWAMQYE
jgi:hypothetical protein